METAAADLAQFVQRRELMAHEQRVARTAYAYGVDLRRATWLDQSTLGNPLIRSVDRRWNETTAALADETQHASQADVPATVLEEIARIMRLLRAPLPSVRILRREREANDWPIVTPLGTTRGGAYWLVLDQDRLLARPANEQTFLLASALGNLQCDHGPLITAHLMAHRRGRGLPVVRTLLRPWSKVAVFSADRAALLALGNLAPALDALRVHAEPKTAWMPPVPDTTIRLAALEDFNHSRVMTRLRLLSGDRTQWSVVPPLSTSPPTSESANAPRPPVQATGADSNAQAPDDAATLEALQQAWSLTRCDERLTRRLRLV